MAGKKATPVEPSPPSTQRNGSTTSSPKGRPKQASEEAPAAGAKARSAPKPRKITKEKAAAAKKKRDKPEPQEGGKRKKQQASGDAATPAKKMKKGDGPETKPQKEPKPAKKKQPSGKPEKPATPSKKHQSSSKPGKPATPSKKHQSPGQGRKSAAPATSPTKKKQAKLEKPTPTKGKRGGDEPQKEPRSPKGASGDGEAPASTTPVKKKRKDQKAAAADMGACSFPMARVRQLMRAEDATVRASNEAVFLINKASEFFLGKFAEDAYRNALKDRKKSIIYDNVSRAVCSQKGFKFLSDFVPQRVTAEDALKAAES